MISKIAIIVPTPVESKLLRSRIDPEPEESLKVIFEGELYGKSIIFGHCGVGKVNAAHLVTLLLENYEFDLVMLYGIGGAYSSSELNIGDVVIAENENYAEEGVLTVDGWKSMEFTGFPLLKNEMEFYNTFPMDKNLLEFALKTLKDTGLKISSGNFVTVSQCSGTLKIGKILEERFNGICENTEGAAVAHLCALYKKKMIEIRAISNIIEDRDMRKWNIPLAVLNINIAVMELIKRLK